MPRVVVRVKKNERICYLFARRIWKSQKVVRALSRGQKTVQNEMEKKIVFYFRKTPDHSCFRLDKIYKKSADARFFGPFYNFFLFLKMSKIQKKRKNFQKIVFFLMLCGDFDHKYVVCKMRYIFQFMPWNKNPKKLENIFFETFF